MAKGYKALREAYHRQSDEFTELNKQYNRAVRQDAMTDELELQFLRAERELKESYRSMQAQKVEEGNKPGRGNN